MDNKEIVNIDKIFEEALNDPSLLSTIDIDNLLNSIESTKNDYLENKTMDDITNDIYEKIDEINVPQNKKEDFYKKLTGYRYVDEIYELHKGKMVRWIRIGNTNLTNGGIVMDIKFLDNGIHILCMNNQRRFIQYKFDDCYTFQKMNTEEQLILMAYSQLS